MTNAELEATEHRTLDRRDLLRHAVWGTAGAVVATGIATAGGTRPAFADSGARRATFDVACLLDTFTFVSETTPPPGGDPLNSFRGVPFYVEGELYPSGSLTGNSAGAALPAGAIGHWICRGFFMNHPDRPDPHVISQQEYLLGRMTDEDYFPADQLASSGTEGDAAGRTVTRSVVGGAGRFAGATGQVLQQVIGQNITGGPNFRFDFQLQKHSD